MAVVTFVTRMGQTQVCAGRRRLRLDERSAHCNILARRLRDGSGLRSSVAPLERRTRPGLVGRSCIGHNAMSVNAYVHMPDCPWTKARKLRGMEG